LGEEVNGNIGSVEVGPAKDLSRQQGSDLRGGHFFDWVGKIDNHGDAIPSDLCVAQRRVGLIGDDDLGFASFHKLNGTHRLVPIEVDGSAGSLFLKSSGEILKNQKLWAVVGDYDATRQADLCNSGPRKCQRHEQATDPNPGREVGRCDNSCSRWSSHSALLRQETSYQVKCKLCDSHVEEGNNPISPRLRIA